MTDALWRFFHSRDWRHIKRRLQSHDLSPERKAALLKRVDALIDRDEGTVSR